MGCLLRVFSASQTGQKKSDAAGHQGHPIASAYSLTSLLAGGQVTLYSVIRRLRVSTGRIIRGSRKGQGINIVPGEVKRVQPNHRSDVHERLSVRDLFIPV
jgi:hypothetical protein